MNLNEGALEALCDIAIEAAQRAAHYIRDAASSKVTVEYKPGANSLAAQIVTEVDRNSEQLIVDILAPTLSRYELALLSEEREDDGQRLHKAYFWCIDPLDGTLAFTQGRPGYAVSIALVSREGLPVIGVVADPYTGTLYSAIYQQGLKRNGRQWSTTEEDKSAGRTKQLRLPCDRSLMQRPDFDELILGLSEAYHALGFSNLEQHHHAGAVISAIQLLEHPPGLYFKPPKDKPGGGSLWDFAATACLLQEAGMVVGDVTGHPLELNRADSCFMNHKGVLMASDPRLAEIARSVILRHTK